MFDAMDVPQYQQCSAQLHVAQVIRLTFREHVRLVARLRNMDPEALYEEIDVFLARLKSA
jgi:hypothetical protein